MNENENNLELIEGIDFYINENGYMVFTQFYHLKRGYCCDNGCKHCPYTEQPKVPLK
ncbi:DUF5522 domain-containing protein [Fluviispira vulneris]|uniref:DUF5522 domain-containing protein n=1 Tax=Fluviispira vulneris TaxID=2763012 RepID=UPI001646F0AD